MDGLSYATLERIGYDGFLLDRHAPEKVLQFGEGNFLRAFVDRFFDIANERGSFFGSVALVQPIDGSYRFADGLNAQDCLYTVYLRGRDRGAKIDESRIISSCSRCLNPYRAADYRAIMGIAASDALEIIVSNTTEAGIAYDPSCSYDDQPPASFPAKLTLVLHERWKAGKRGVIILSCELIDHNGAELLRVVRRHCEDWHLKEAFKTWVETDCAFCTTLVDTIVPGRIRDAEEIKRLSDARGYTDPFADAREVFEMWGIQGDEALESRLPFKAAGLQRSVFVTPDVDPFKRRKVRILNGAHSGFAPGAWLSGFEIVRDCMHDETVRGFMSAMLQREVIPTLAVELDRGDLKNFAAAVQDRFDNPFIDHQLLSICLNSTAKWRARNLPTLLDYARSRESLPPCLTTSLAALIAFYTTGLEGLADDGLHLRRRDGTAYVAQDDRDVLEFYSAHASDQDEELTGGVLAAARMWGQDLTEVPGLRKAVAAALALIREQGVRAAFAACLA